MDFRKDGTGGSDGCVDFHNPDNRGLSTCLVESGIPSVFAKHCGTVSLADFVVIAAEAAMGRTSPDYQEGDPFNEDGLLSSFKNNFLAGRETQDTCPEQDNRMPDPEQGCGSLQDVFIDNIFHLYKDKEAWAMTTALSGAHTLGSAKPENSGYEGHWSEPHDQGVFNNGYFKSLLLKGWAPDLAVGGKTDRNQWRRADSDAPSDFRHLMLNTDLCLVYDNNKEHQKCLDENKGPKRIACNFSKFKKYGVPL